MASRPAGNCRRARWQEAPGSTNPAAPPAQRRWLDGPDPSIRRHEPFAKERSALPTRRSTSPSKLHDEVVLIHGNLEGFSDIRPFDQRLAGLDGDRETTHPCMRRVTPRLAGADVELPAMPRAAQQFAFTAQPVAARLVG